MKLKKKTNIILLQIYIQSESGLLFHKIHKKFHKKKKGV